MKLHIFHTGKVCVSPYLPFGGDGCSLIKASGIFGRKEDRLWLPVSAYLLEHPRGKVLIDCGWHREMSPKGIADKKSQIKSLDSRILYHVNQGVVGQGEAIDEQLLKIGITPSDLDYVLLTHLDCDHANGLSLVADAKNILVAADELKFANKSIVRYQKCWWKNVKLQTFNWTGNEGYAGKSYDLFDDESVQLVNIPGHSKGLFAVKITSDSGRFILLTSDGAYAAKSWEKMILPGIADDRNAQKKSLQWIKDQSQLENCLMVLANHDTNVSPQTIEF